MLPRNKRVSRKLFETTYRVSRSFSSPFFVLKTKGAQESPADGEASRFAFSISAKICPKAVDRNKFRRRGYSVIENLYGQIKAPAVCLFIAKKGVEKLNFQKFQEEIKNILQKAGIV